ncbi:hypothetical protein F4803DRAFT_244798 [Xylaria telfairii]|nr:hypothetical protein F4803DRAFT_244798 [Xylaria telfairii]
MSAPSDRDQYSTLEVASDADVLRQGKYPEVYGYYGPVKTDQPAGLGQQDARSFSVTTHSQLPPTAQSYTTYPEVVDNSGVAAAGSSKGAKICGLRRKYFWIALGVAILVIIGVVVGAVVGSMSSHASTSSDHGNDGNGGNAGQDNTNNGTGTGTTKLTLYNNTQLASANFTDAYGNENYLLVYQLSDASLSLSAFNSSKNKWVVSTIVNGSEGIKLGSSLALSTFWQGTNRKLVILMWSVCDRVPL